jgi:hypothetical protein
MRKNILSPEGAAQCRSFFLSAWRINILCPITSGMVHATEVWSIPASKNTPVMAVLATRIFRLGKDEVNKMAHCGFSALKANRLS